MNELKEGDIVELNINSEFYEYYNSFFKEREVNVSIFILRTKGEYKSEVISNGRLFWLMNDVLQKIKNNNKYIQFLK